MKSVDFSADLVCSRRWNPSIELMLMSYGDGGWTHASHIIISTDGQFACEFGTHSRRQE